uniref:hypothetical protein n=1 Tax=Anaplasma phagocytophilum TaxID=948 RepID=UPI00201A93E4
MKPLKSVLGRHCVRVLVRRCLIVASVYVSVIGTVTENTLERHILSVVLKCMSCSFSVGGAFDK